MANKIFETEAYKDFELKHNRHLNMMADTDRNLRRQALNEFKKASNEKNLEVLEFFYREKLCKRLVIALDDQVEKIREISIEILTTLIERCGFKEESQILLPAICNRMSKVPYPENSEEVRVELIELLSLCLDTNQSQFVPVLGQICVMLGKALQDQNPEMKIAGAALAGKICVALKNNAGGYMKGAIEAMVGNLAHQHSKVRKQTLKGLKEVAICKGAEPYMEGNPLHQLKFTMNDRSQDVRAEFYRVLFHWMTKMDIHYLLQYESSFTQMLLNGIADEVLDISPQCISFIEDHGKRMKDALKQLGEDVDEPEEVEEVKPTKIQDDNVPIESHEPQPAKSQESDMAMEEID